MNLNLLKLLCAKSSLLQTNGETLEKRETTQKSSQLLKSLALSLLFVAISSVGFAQYRAATGTVTDTDGLPIIGATVMIDGTTTGTTTDIDGNYSISPVSEATVLVFSYIGYETQSVPVGARTKIDIALETAAEDIGEVVVVGYGVQKKETLTGSIVQVDGDEVMAGKGTSSALVAMQGEMPGVTVTRSSTRPGNESADIKIRGDMSVNGVSPLILLDGVEISETQLSQINSMDIASYSVLKDGSAAIFGTKAAGGVILVTTKRGEKGAVKIDFNAELQINTPIDFPLATMQEWAEMCYTGGGRSAVDYIDANGDAQVGATTYPGFFSADQYLNIMNGGTEEWITYNAPNYYPTPLNSGATDNGSYYDYMYGTTLSQRYNVSASGGTDKVTYRSSLGYSNERSVLSFVYDGARKYNFRTNVGYQISDMLTTDFSVSYDNRITDTPTQGIGSGIDNPWMFPIYNLDGNYYGAFGTGVNYLAQLDEGGRTTNSQEILNIGGVFTLDMDKYVKGLSFKYSGNFSRRYGEKMARSSQYTVYDWGDTDYTSASSTTTTANDTYVQYTLAFTNYQNNVLQANWDRSFGDHNLGLMVGMTAETKGQHSYSLKRTNMSTNDLDDLDTGDTTTDSLSGGSYKSALVSYMARFNYNYKGIYIAEGSIRRDGSSCLSLENRWANFLYGSAGVRLSELDALKGGFFDNLKVFGSYGETGSTTGIDSYDAFSTITTSSRYFGLDDVTQANTAYMGMTSDDRTWERVAKSNIGVDFTILDGRLSGIVEYFYNTNNDMLVSVTYPQVLGGTAPKTNSGDFKAQGWEVALTWRDNIGDDFSYSVGLSAWDSQSEVVTMEGANTISPGSNSTIEGYPLNSLFMYETNGIFQNEADVLSYYEAYGFSDPDNQLSYKSGTQLSSYAYRSSSKLVAGCVERVDTNGDGSITTDDATYFGDQDAHYSYGINLSMKYKNWDFTAFFQGVGQQNIYRTGRLSYPFASWWTNQNPYYIDSTWSETNTDAEQPMYFGKGDSRNTWNYRLNDINVVKASYLRAKTISLGYNVPNEVANKIGFSNARIAVSGNDLFVISNIQDGLDAEQASAATTVFPMSSSVIFNLQFSL
ncbi:MAG: SusC/RagA family TonB-linked outer membrane protein [Rikenellaceae bacterium]